MSGLSGKSDRAYYAILMTEARYKAGFDDVLDSLISTAVDFYKDDMANPLRTRAYYYNGIINWNSKRLVDAVISLKEAEKSALETGDSLHLALIHRSFGDCYYGMFNHKTALIYFKRSYDEFESIHNSYYLPDASYDLLCGYFNIHNYDSCLLVGERALIEFPDMEDSVRRLITKLMGQTAIIKKDYVRGIEYYDRYLTIPGAALSLSDVPFIGIAAFQFLEKREDNPYGGFFFKSWDKRQMVRSLSCKSA